MTDNVMVKNVQTHDPSSASSSKPRYELWIEVAVHLITWCYIFLSPLLFKRSGESLDWSRYLHGCLLPLVTCFAFYVNYFVLIPRFLLVKGKLTWFVLSNIVLLAVCQTCLELQPVLFPPMDFPKPLHHRRFREPGDKPFMIPHMFFVVRGFLIIVFAIDSIEVEYALAQE